MPRTKINNLISVSISTMVGVSLSVIAPVFANAGDTGKPSDTSLEEVVVFARGEELIGQADSASEGAVGGADLTVRPLLRVAELLEVVPGMIAAQHSGSGKANQYFLRGFNLDHGTDFTAYIDDVPMNLRTHGHGQGYLDMNGLIPEVVDRIEYHKGPYFADLGDFSLAGAALMQTVDEIDPFISFEAGEYGWVRVATGDTFDADGGRLALAGQWKTYDGPWELKENLQHQSLWGKYRRRTGPGMLEVTASAYHADWRPTEQIPERAIGTAVCKDEFCAIDPTAVGTTWRWVTGARLTGDDWRSTVYFQYYDWHMLSNPTYDFQINQFDRRWIGGGRYEHDFTLAPSLNLTGGIEGRYDDITNVGVEHTNGGLFVSPISRHGVNEGSAGAYTKIIWTPIDHLRLIGGLRGDWYNFDVKAKTAGLDEGNVSTGQISPKIGVAYQLNDRVELYANWGQGFHSNDARGVVNSVTPVPGLVAGTGYESGARFEIGNFKLTTTYWWLQLDSELKFVGDSNSVEPAAGSNRRGYELVAFWRPLDWLAVDAVWTGSHARFDNSPGSDNIPQSVENAGELGISAIQDRWEASLRVRHLGSYPLIEDNSRRAHPETMVNMRCAWHWDKFTLYGDLLNVFDSRAKDIVYYYPSNVAGLDPPGVEVDDNMSRVAEPRTLRMGIKYMF